jgi:GNAT superfamily N-acetyltransferase
MANLEISFTPTSDHIHQIMHWMQHDERKFRDGLIDNWNFISQAFSENRVCVALSDFVAVGFSAWKPYEVDTYTIEYLQIKSESRKKDIGKTLVNEVEKLLISNGGLVVMGNSISDNSNAFWLKMENKTLPQVILDKKIACRDASFIYKVLVDTLQPNTLSPSKETLELWANDDYKVDADHPADYVWSLCKLPHFSTV